jgi:hypothetical protein
MNETVIITENPEEGTKTVIEVTTVDENAPDLEDVVDALLDENPAVDLDETPADEVNVEVYTIPTDADLTDTLDTSATPDTSADVSFDSAATAETAEEAAAEAETQAHTEAATEAQEAADEFVASGDYEAASQAREAAENEAWEAADSSMLHGSDSTELEGAAFQQENAEYYEQQEAAHAQEGDYEAAREDASNAVYATQDADFLAGGDDHSGQAQAEQNQMDWAVWEEGNADYNAQQAEEYAEEGNFDAAEMYAEEAADHQENADYYGDLGEHGGDIGVTDASSDVDSGGTYDAADDSSYDTSSTDFSTE